MATITTTQTQQRSAELNVLARKQRSLWLDAWYRLRRNRANLTTNRNSKSETEDTRQFVDDRLNGSRPEGVIGSISMCSSLSPLTGLPLF